jgi:hypothetical protein
MPPPVSFQDQEYHPSVTPEAENTWRIARASLSQEARNHTRANNLEYMATNDLIPEWALGMAPIPGYLEPCITDLIQLRRQQGTDMLVKGSEALKKKAQQQKLVGEAQTTAFRQLYGTNRQGLQKAEDKIKELIARDNASCAETLKSRTNATRDNFITDHMIAESLTMRSWSTTNSRYQSTGRPTYQQQQRQSTRPSRGNPRGNTRGTYRGRFPYTRYTSPSRGRYTSPSRGRSPRRDRSPSRGRPSNRGQQRTPRSPTRYSRTPYRGRSRGRGRRASSSFRMNLTREEQELIDQIRSRNTY